MRRQIGLAMATVLALSLALTAVSAEQSTPTQTKTGTVKKVDVAAKTVTVMAARELTFTVTDATKIVEADAPKSLADIKEGVTVTVEYTRAGDVRTAVRIVVSPPTPPPAK
jgi:Cu/Ag efflux protein CusF